MNVKLLIRTTLAVLVSGLWGGASAQNAQPLADGPHVFYHGDSIVVKSLVPLRGSLQAVTGSFPAAKKAGQLLEVHLDGHPDWDFTVSLKAGTAPRASAFAGACRILVLSDIEGEFEPFRNLLLAAKVTDGKYNWTFGKGKLVIAGDLFDRGRQVCQFLWLLYKLEDEARAAGGDVNVILGNHDVMNLDGDFRYIQPEYQANARLLDEPYARLYGADTELGRWLRSKNTVEKIGDLLVLHGGVSPVLLGRQMGPEAVNASCRPYYAVPPRQVPDSLVDFFNANGLFWYRGYFLEPKATQGLVDSTLSFYHCRKIIVGHDIIRHVNSFYQDKVIGVDVDEHNGVHEGLLIEKDQYYRIDDKGNKVKIIH